MSHWVVGAYNGHCVVSHGYSSVTEAMTVKSLKCHTAIDGREIHIHPALALRPSFVPENVGVGEKGVNEKLYYHQNQGFSVIERRQPK